MIANYHTHTRRCHHAVGEEREYIEHAIKGGLQVLGFADHAPMPFPDGYYSGFRMRVEQTAEYFDTLRALQKEYEKDIRILIGFEAEYYPDVFDDFLALVEPFAPDYLIMGQHALDNEVGAYFPSQATTDPALLKKYVDQITAGLATGKFLYQAHPDMMRFEGDPAVYEREMTRYLTFCKEYDIPVEINLLGMMDNRWYPRKEFWPLVANVGNRVVIGCDAHRPDVLSNKALHRQGEEWAARFGLTVTPMLDV